MPMRRVLLFCLLTAIATCTDTGTGMVGRSMSDQDQAPVLNPADRDRLLKDIQTFKRQALDDPKNADPFFNLGLAY
ncbi:MAG: hypothetical protein HY710_07525, partial [Candidatus Latescibacteria bacterium]|nr:hypothetical protein [Candidatus Latescibacterota bacterium]